MRASYVNGREHLTPVGEWIAARLPHVQAWKKKTWRGWRVYGGKPLFRKCLVAFSAKADGYMVAYYPFKYVYWDMQLSILGRVIWKHRRLFHRHRARPELRAPASHLIKAHNRMWDEIFAGRAAIKKLAESEAAG